MTFQFIAKSLPTGSSSQIIFSSIPQTYKDLVIMYVMKCNDSSGPTFNTLFVNVNAQTTPVLFRNVSQSNSNNAFGNSLTQTSGGLQGVRGTEIITQNGSPYASGMFYFGDYTSSNGGNSIYNSSALYILNSSTRVNTGSAFYNSQQGPITNILLQDINGSNILSGSSIYLYGVS